MKFSLLVTLLIVAKKTLEGLQLTLDNEHRVQIEVSGVTSVLCASNGTRHPVHNDTLATLMCAELGLGDVGIGFDLPLVNGSRMVATLVWYESGAVDIGEETVGCGDVNTTLGVHCTDSTAMSCTRAIVGSFLRETCELAGETLYRCGETNEYYRRNTSRHDYCYLTRICRDESDVVYQSCGCPGVKMQDAMCNSIVCEQEDADGTNNRNLPTRRICDGYYNCIDHSDERNCNYSSSLGMFCTISFDGHHYGWVPNIYMCDSFSDCKYGEDEVECGFNYGVKCVIGATGKWGWVDNRGLCDGVMYCRDGDDEDATLCAERQEVGLTCPDIATGAMTDIKKLNMCYYPRSYSATTSNFHGRNCKGFIDQTNCSMTDVLSCTVQGLQNTRVRDRWLCNNWDVCDDGRDEMCHYFSEQCNVHKYMMCDDVLDCPQGEDETEANCEMSNSTCERWLTREQNIDRPIPNAWICDGVKDCTDGHDEDNDYWDCKSGLECPDKAGTFVKIENLCDGIESCSGAEGKLCTAARLKGEVYNTEFESKEHLHYTNGHIMHHFLHPCLPGLMKENSEHLPSKCVRDVSNELNVNKTTAHVHFRWDGCNSTTGWDSNLRFKFDACRIAEKSGRLAGVTECESDRIVYNKTEDSNVLQKYIQFHEGKLADMVFHCDNMNCIDKELVCNLVDDCGDGSDEHECSQTFYCAKGHPNFIPKYQTCDGSYDCSDNSDECSDICSTDRILKNTFIRCYTLLLGLAVLALNSYTIKECTISMITSTSASGMMKANHLFVVVIGFGDWCMGLYMIIVFAYDIFYHEDYCWYKFDWLTSKTCSFLGVLSTFGSTLSIFIMVLVALFRLIQITGLMDRFQRNGMDFIGAIVACTLVVFLTIMLTVIPLLKSQEDYFTNGMYYKQNPLFPKFADMNSHVELIDTYKRIAQINEDTPRTWSYIKRFVKDMFVGEQHPSFYGKSHTFYGNDAVCLFKYFVKETDPQKEFSVSLTVINCTSFVVIFLCYSYVVHMIKTLQNTKCMIQDRRQRRLQRKIQAKMTIIILTNFVTWVPFCILCWIYLNGVNIDKGRIYKFAALIFLPLNSLMNPLIYNELPIKLYKHAKERLSGALTFASDTEGPTPQANTVLNAVMATLKF